jgi:hypothetical protein
MLGGVGGDCELGGGERLGLNCLVTSFATGPARIASELDRF